MTDQEARDFEMLRRRVEDLEEKVSLLEKGLSLLDNEFWSLSSRVQWLEERENNNEHN
jgi:predicted nuclease with TOPRIM domain